MAGRTYESEHIVLVRLRSGGRREVLEDVGRMNVRINGGQSGIMGQGVFGS